MYRTDLCDDDCLFACVRPSDEMVTRDNARRAQTGVARVIQMSVTYDEKHCRRDGYAQTASDRGLAGYQHAAAAAAVSSSSSPPTASGRP